MCWPSFLLPCDLLVSHGNLLGLQNCIVRVAFGDLAFPQGFGGEVPAGMLPGLGCGVSAPGCEMTPTW